MDNSTIKSRFSKILSELMNCNPVTGEKVTQKKLADFLGVSRITIYYYLTQKYYPEYSQLVAIAGYFGVTVDYLLTGKQPENKSLRDSLHLSDAAINNLASCDKEFAPFVDKLLSDKDFFTTYQNAIKPIQDTRRDLLNGWELIDYQQSSRGLVLGGFARMSAYFEKFLSRLVKNEIPAQECELTEKEKEFINNLPPNLKPYIKYSHSLDELKKQ